MQGADGSIQMVPNYHIADHLGSVRTIIDGSTGQVIEANDYYAFGGRWDRSGSLVDQSNSYRYNGKEELPMSCLKLVLYAIGIHLTIRLITTLH